MATYLQSVEREFRKMTLELAQRLHKSDCDNIIHLDQLPTPDDASNFNLIVLNSLEANGYTSPSNTDHLESLLSEIHRLDLLPVVASYKDYKNPKKKRKRGTKKDIATGPVFNLAPSASDSEEMKMVKSLFTILLTNTTQQMQILEHLRKVLGKTEEESVGKAMEQFQMVAREGEKFAENLEKVSRMMAGINSKRSSTSSDDTPAVSPTTGT